MKRIVFLIATLALIGCELCHYNKPGASTDQIHSDQNQCEEEAAKTASSDKKTQQAVEVKCMAARGYHPIDQVIR